MQSQAIMTAAPSASMQEMMQWILSTQGYDGLRAYLHQMSTQQLDSLLVASEMRGIFSNVAAAIPQRQQVPSRASLLLPGLDYPRTNSLFMPTVPHFPTTMSNANPPAVPAHDGMMAASSLYANKFETLQLSGRPVLIPPAAQEQLKQQPDGDHAVSLFVESDRTFLDPVHNLLRCDCIEVFVATKNDMTGPGKGARPTKVGQVGLRCFYCKEVPRQDLEVRLAVCFPSRRDTIFESMRNYQRKHLDACPHIPKETKSKYKNLLQQNHSPRKKPHQVLKAYYAEAASELGLVDTPFGLMFGTSQNKSGTPSEKMQAIIRAAESPTKKFASFWKKNPSCKDKAIEMRKFEHVASDNTRKIIINARKEPTAFVYPQDFPTIADVDFLLFHQVKPFKPAAERLENRGLNSERFHALCGLRCKHCARDNGEENGHRGAYFPTDLTLLSDSGFSQTLLNHLMSCPNVPPGTKNALDELKRLAVEYGIPTKRGSKKNFFRKIWGRMEKYYE